MTARNRIYEKEEKDQLIIRMLPPESCTPTELSKETGISKSTLAAWKVKALKGIKSKDVGRPKNTLTSRDKFLITMETYTLSEIELSKYCRQHGLYVEEVKKWRSSCMDANTTKKKDNADSTVLKAELAEEKKKLKQTEKELRRKEKALAETAALLVLRKKLNAIFEDQEED